MVWLDSAVVRCTKRYKLEGYGVTVIAIYSEALCGFSRTPCEG